VSVRPHPTHAGWYHVRYYDADGKQVVISHPGPLEDAQKYEEQLRIEARQTPAHAAFTPLAQIIPAFMQQYRLDHQPSGASRTARSIKILVAFFGRYQINAINPAIIDTYKTKRLVEEKVKPTTINKELCALSSVCKWAVERGYAAKMPAIKKFPGKLVKAPIPKVLTKEECSLPPSRSISGRSSASSIMPVSGRQRRCISKWGISTRKTIII
jgi:hypothetical protein